MSTRIHVLAVLSAVALFAACAPARAPEDGMTPTGLMTAAATGENGIATNGIATNGIATNGIATNGIATNGIATNGIATNGIATNGIATNGIATNGIATNGIATNGIATNGIATNGIATNGIATNGLAAGTGTSGLAVNGLTEDGLDTQEFHDWFAANPAYADMVMRYVARCALPDGAALGYELGEASYSWAGTFGLTPGWAAGQAITAGEQELLTACLAAHTNALGRHVTISVRGYRTDGSTIDVTEEEAQGWRFHEACFFGNLFDGAGVGVGVEPDSLRTDVSTPRGCAAEFGVPGDCAPMIHVGMCADLCALGADGVTYESCTVNGRSYRPLQVFLQDSDVYVCGDGTCQFTETAERCAVDCAVAP
jgi:hypothetical protein